MNPFTSWLLASAFVVASHIGGYFIEKEIEKIPAPQVAIVYNLNEYHPIVEIRGGDVDSAFEIEYLTPVGMQVFRATKPDGRTDVAYASPCYVRARYSNGDNVSQWSKLLLAEPQPVDFFQ